MATFTKCAKKSRKQELLLISEASYQSHWYEILSVFFSVWLRMELAVLIRYHGISVTWWLHDWSAFKFNSVLAIFSVPISGGSVQLIPHFASFLSYLISFIILHPQVLGTIARILSQPCSCLFAFENLSCNFPPQFLGKYFTWIQRRDLKQKDCQFRFVALWFLTLVDQVGVENGCQS